MSDNSAAADAMPVRRALQRCSSGPGCPCASHSDDSSSAARSPPSGSPSRSRSASTENTNSGDSINDNGSYRFTDSESGKDVFPTFRRHDSLCSGCGSEMNKRGSLVHWLPIRRMH
ncbi:uncharacterized protein [Miscanthus floridulus]|uniref:uncharacterized protein isoform X2 n=1 Tax=Miscanthus floridulus TaxID=154761 RepID=UPI00345AAF51